MRIAPARIAETEAALGVSFPAAFKLYMSRSNGGTLRLDDEDWVLFPFRDATDRETIRRTAEDICRETQRALEAGVGFPSDGVAIADNGAGDLLFLRREGDRLRDELWRYRLRGGEVDVALEDVAELWEAATRIDRS